MHQRPPGPGHPMMDTPARSHKMAARAARELAAVQQQTVQARQLLTQVQHAVQAAGAKLETLQTPELLQANEHLVLASLDAQAQARKATEDLAKISRHAEHDALTGLPNRQMLMDRFAQSIARSRRRRARLALLFVDLNRFKQINDTLGHAVGDGALQLAAHRMSAAVRESDTVSRFGGDEFLILLDDVAHPREAQQIADKVLHTLRQPARLGDHDLALDACVGISFYPEHGSDAKVLIHRADSAMYRAKRQGLDHCVYADEAGGR